jgi:hypothetical protein
VKDLHVAGAVDIRDQERIRRGIQVLTQEAV